MAITAVTGFSEPFVDTHPFYRGTYFVVVGRTATGSGTGSASVAHTNFEQRLGQLTDFSFPFRFGGRFYLGVRAVVTVTATASGLGTASSVAQVLRQRTATGSGAGSDTAVSLKAAIRSAMGSGVGTMDSTGLHLAPRTASGSGVGSATTVGKITPVRTAYSNSTGSSTTLSVHVVVRTGTNAGTGTSTASSYVTAIRTAAGSGTGTSATVGARLSVRTATGTGQSVDTFAVWMKSHIFRVPYTTTYSQGTFRGEGTANRLQSYNRSGVRALNLYHLTDDSYTTVEQRDMGQVLKLWHGGRDHFLTDAEVTELTAAGFGASIT